MLPAVLKPKEISKALGTSLPKYYSQQEVGTIITEDLRQADYTAWFLCLFLWNTGVRVSEALGVMVGDIDLMGRAMRVETLKRTGHTRVIPLQNGFVGEVALWINTQELKRGNQLFSFTRATAFNKVRKACQSVDLDDGRAHPHTFRHSFAVNAILHGVPVTVLKEWLGHRDIMKTLIYTQILAQDTRAFMEGVTF